MYISIRKRRMITAVVICMAILGFAGALLIDAFSSTSAAYSAQVGVRELVRYNTYNALEPGLGAMLADGDYTNASGSLVDIIALSLNEQGIEVAMPDIEAIKDKVERELQILGEGGYIVVDEEGNISEETKSYISNSLLRIISGHLPLEDDKENVRAQNSDYDFSISSLGAVQDIKKQIDGIEEQLMKMEEITDTEGTITHRQGIDELKELKNGLMAVETIVDTMEQDLNNRNERIETAGSDGMLSNDVIAEELASQNVRILAQYDSITEIEKRILELYGEIEGSFDKNSEEVVTVKDNLDAAVANIETLKEQMSEKISDGESTLFTAIDSTTKDLIAYKASMEGVTGDISRTVENLEASITGTMTSNYTELHSELTNTYEQILSQIEAENMALEQELKDSGQALEQKRMNADATLLEKIEISGRQLAAEISDTDTRLKNALALTDKKLSEELSSTDQRLSEALESTDQRLSQALDSTDQRLSQALDSTDQRLSQALREADESLRELIDSSGEYLENEIGVAGDTASRLISSILTKDGTLTVDSIEELACTTADTLNRELAELEELIGNIQSAVNATEAGTDGSRIVREEILDELDDLLSRIETACGTVEEYEADMQQRALTIDSDSLGSISMSEPDADVRQAMIDASSELISLQNAQSSYERQLSDMLSELVLMADRIKNEASDYEQMLLMESNVDTLTRSLDSNVDTLSRSIDSNVESLNGTISELDERMGNMVSDLDTRMDNVEAETKLICLADMTIRPSDWTASGTQFIYRITSEKISSILQGNYDVQISIRYAADTSISPEYYVCTEGDISYICISVGSVPAGNTAVKQVVIYYRAGSQ